MCVAVRCARLFWAARLGATGAGGASTARHALFCSFTVVMSGCVLSVCSISARLCVRLRVWSMKAREAGRFTLSGTLSSLGQPNPQPNPHEGYILSYISLDTPLVTWLSPSLTAPYGFSEAKGRRRGSNKGVISRGAFLGTYSGSPPKGGVVTNPLGVGIIPT